MPINNQLSDAKRYNLKSKYPFDSVHPRGSLAFAKEIQELQFNLGFKEHECDGKLGYQTYCVIRDTFEEHILMGGVQIEMSKSEAYRLVSFDEPDGLDLHKYGNFSARKSPISAVCLHWGGLDAEHCFNVFSSDSRDVSSHFLIGLESGSCVVYQVLDLKHKAWHAGKVNDWTIGIDICQQPTLRWEKHYNLPTKMNPTSRGEREVLILDPVLASGANAFIKDLMAALNLEVKIPQGHDVQDVTDCTLFGHHHVSKRKWDVACWWEELTNG